jgi:hypothetical protein
MLLEEIKENLEEIMSLLAKCKKSQEEQGNDFILNEYFEKTKELLNKFKHWNPEVFIFVTGGTITDIHANCKTGINIFDDDAESVGEHPGRSYQEVLDEWNYMIESSVEDKTLIQIL